MNWIDTISESGSPARFGGAAQQLFAHSPLRLLGLFFRWLTALQDARVARLQLRSLDEHMLKDIGMTRGQVEDHLRLNSPRFWS